MVITSLSITAFAAGEQPSGSSYTYISATGSSASSTYWTAVTQSIYQIGQWLKPLKDSTFRYFDGTSTASTNNFFSALANSLYYIGANVRTNFTSLISDTGTIASRISTTNNSLSTISSTQLPTQSGYSYDNNTGSVSNQTYWSATSNQLSFIFRRLATLNTNIEDIESNMKDYSTVLSNINDKTTNIRTYTSNTATNTSSIASSASNIDSTTTNIDTTTGSILSEATNIKTRLPYGTAFPSVNGDGTIDATSQRTYWQATNRSVTYLGNDVNALRLFLDDLHTMFASPEDLALKADQENNISSATTSFLSGNDSATSVGTGSIGKVKDLGDDAAAWFDTGVQATSLFDALSNDDTDDGPWMWFTQATMDDLDSTSSNRSSKGSASPGEYVPDLYGAKMDELRRMLNSVSEVESKSSQNYVYTADDFPRQEVPDYVD